MPSLSSFTSAYRIGQVPKAARGFITALDSLTEIEDKKSIRALQYFPESIQDTKTTNYQAKEIPGLSHPLYQWTAGGPREISFTAIFTRDRVIDADSKKKFPNDSFFANKSNEDPRNVDIPSAIAWLRSFKYPTYRADLDGQGVGARAHAPSKLILTLPGTRINTGVKGPLSRDEVLCVMLNCEVTYDAFFNDGSPRIARAQLSFAEIIQHQGFIKPHDGIVKRAEALAGYKLEPESGVTKGKK